MLQARENEISLRKWFGQGRNQLVLLGGGGKWLQLVVLPKN